MSGLRRLSRAREIQEEGLAALLKRSLSFAYARLWPLLPKSDRRRRFNGVEAAARKSVLDPYLPEFVVSRTPASPDQPDYEAPLLDGLREHVRSGDDVVVVGGGRGISAIVAAEGVGPTGSVVVYEATAEMLQEIEDNVAANGYAGRINVRHAVIGSYHSHNEEIYGGAEGADGVEVASLPDCDVLELDCEGAEVEILSRLEIRPRTIIVETHGFLGADEGVVRAELDRLGYEVRARETESESQGVYVLTAVRD
jgi:hypothetical protein